MSVEVLLLALLASMTVVAFMITLNTRGKWRATLSAMLSACLMGFTVWVFTLQYSATAKDESQGERHRVELRELLDGQGDRAAGADKPGGAQKLAATVEEASSFADKLAREKLYDPNASHGQLIARANEAETRFEALADEINALKHVIDQLPDAAPLLAVALEDLKGACHFYKSYYYAENTDGEISTERLMKQKARSAGDSLAKAARAVKEYK